MRLQRLAQFFFVMICFGLLLVTSSLHAQPDAQALFQSTLIPGTPVVLLAGQSPQTARFLPATNRSSIQSATFVVNYTGFSAEAKAAFQRAVDIWAGEITSSVPIVINATWAPLDTGVLGAATTADFAISSSTAQFPNTLYPIALGNKIAGSDLAPNEPDIIAQFNSTMPSWYYGTDGNAPANTYDLVTVVLHEIGHGLGFLGSMNGANSSGTWGLNGFPIIYDQFAVNGSNQQLLNTTLFPNPSTALGTQLRSNNLFFNGPQAVAAAGTSPKLYAPLDWQSGSSFSHLDESTYATGNANALMTPILDDGEVLHDIGSITRAIFSDIGWTTGSAPASTGTRTPTNIPTSTQTATNGTAVAGTATLTAPDIPSGSRKNFLPMVSQGSTNLATLTPLRTATPGAPTASATSSPTASATRTVTIGSTATRTATRTATVTNTPIVSSTSTATNVTTAAATATTTKTPTVANTATTTKTVTNTPSATRTPTPSRTPTITLTPEGT